MPGYVIHLAVGKVYAQNNKIEDFNSFKRGIIEPDMFENKAGSHYGPYSSSPGLNKFIQLNGIYSSYNEGYFLHLVTDYLFYNRFLKKWDKIIYDDYDKLNNSIIQKYEIEISKEIQEKVKFKNGETSILKEADVYQFINSVGKINIREIISQKQLNYEETMLELELEI